MEHVHTGRRGYFRQVSELHDNERHVTIQNHVHNVRYSIPTQDTTVYQHDLLNQYPSVKSACLS
jgi:carbamoylphosphate synthase small subunit